MVITWNSLSDNERLLVENRLGARVAKKIAEVKAGHYPLDAAISYKIFVVDLDLGEHEKEILVRCLFPEIWPVPQEAVKPGCGQDCKKSHKAVDEADMPLLGRERKLLTLLSSNLLRHMALVAIGQEKPLPKKSSFLRICKRWEREIGKDHIYSKTMKEFGDGILSSINDLFKNYT